MLTVVFNPFPDLSTERLILRQINEDDKHELHTLRGDKEIMRFIPRPLTRSAGDATELIQKFNNAISNNESITWAITLKGDHHLIGTIAFIKILKEQYRAEVGYLLHPQHHGKGVMQEALSAVIDYGFKVMKLNSIEALVNPQNIPSAKLLEKNKFIREAYFKEYLLFDGKFLDVFVYSRLMPDA